MVAAIRAVAPDVVIMMDNTWAAGVLFKALDFDIDISIQSGTKYIIGHSDAMLGIAVANARCWEQLREDSYLMGQMVDADTAYLASRGLRTLSVRLKQHEKTALKSLTGWQSARKWRWFIIPHCQAARAMNSTSGILMAAMVCFLSN